MTMDLLTAYLIAQKAEFGVPAAHYTEVLRKIVSCQGRLACLDAMCEFLEVESAAAFAVDQKAQSSRPGCREKVPASHV